jgi:hypothetical protein
MATLSKKLYLKKKGETAVSCDIYTTTAEAGEPNLKLKVAGNDCFVALRTVGAAGTTAWRLYRGSDGKTYAIAVSGYLTITIMQSAHQTITVTANGNKYTTLVTLPYGTKYTVSIVADTGYNVGTLSTTGGTLTGNITVSATAATIKTFTVTVIQPDHGVITINGNSGTTFTFNYGTTITLLCTPNSGYKFTQWQITGNYSMSATNDGIMAAVFESNAEIKTIMTEEEND